MDSIQLIKDLTAAFGPPGFEEDVVAIGDTVSVKVIEIDDQGRINLSRKLALKELGQA